MKLSFFNNNLNHHQVFVADELYNILGNDYAYVTTLPFDKNSLKGGIDYSSRQYCLLAGNSEEYRKQAIELAINADVCIFGAKSLEFAKIRAKHNPNGLSFELSERWLKRGWLNVLSPNLIIWWLCYQKYFRRANFYKLNASAFAADDHLQLFSYKNRCYKWGYFTSVEAADVEAAPDVSTSNITPLMWCARYLMLKHPELPVLLADELRSKGYRFHIDMYGDGEYRPAIEQLIAKHGLTEFVCVHGNVPNGKVREAMAKSQIFLFTSDRNEGWGAVANESLANGCALVASDAIGSSPYLISNGVNGFMFKSASTSSSINNPDREALNDLTQKVEYLLDHSDELRQMQLRAAEQMQTLWSPRHAAESLLQLIDDLKNGRDTSIIEGPCSKA